MQSFDIAGGANIRKIKEETKSDTTLQKAANMLTNQWHTIKDIADHDPQLDMQTLKSLRNVKDQLTVAGNGEISLCYCSLGIITLVDSL